MSLVSTPSFLSAATTEAMEVAAADCASATVGFVIETPMITSATSGATLTWPEPETVTVCSVAGLVGSTASVGWPLMIGPTMMPRSRLAAAVTAIARPRVTGPVWREASTALGAGSFSSLAFEGLSFMAVLLSGADVRLQPFGWLTVGLIGRRPLGPVRS